MQKSSLVARAALVISALVGVLSVAQVSLAQNAVGGSFEQPAKEPTQINVLVGQSRVINFDKPIGRFSVSNPDVA